MSVQPPARSAWLAAFTASSPQPEVLSLQLSVRVVRGDRLGLTTLAVYQGMTTVHSFQGMIDFLQIEIVVGTWVV